MGTETFGFGEWLKRRRKMLDLTREKLAWRAGCSFETIKKIEAGDLKPSAQLAELLAAKLNVPPVEHDAFVQFARSDAHMNAFAFTGLPVAVASPETTPPPLAALPAPVTSLLGRAREIHAARELLNQDAVRLLTLTGPPGAGKTRLSLAIAAQVRDEFADGAAFIPLANVNDPALLFPTIAHGLNVAVSNTQLFDDALFTALREKHLLLILDNFEQIISAAPRASELLNAAPQLKIIVSSREALRVYGEQAFPVPPLDVPDVKHLPPVEALAHYSAVALFVARARAVKPDFELNAENADTVARICALLDGLPLALEMAAVQLRRNSPTRVLAQLEAKLVTLGSGMRDLSPRQQTLRGALDWSYDLLSADEQKLLAYFGVFAGGSTRAAIEAIVSHDESLLSTLGENLENLADKNLVRIEQRDGDTSRITMLELIRDYARDKLHARNAWDTTSARHAEYFLSLAERAKDANGADAAQYEMLEREYDNLRAALMWAFAKPDVLLALRLCRALGAFWQARGYWREGLEWTRRALAVSAQDTEAFEYKTLRADALQLAAQLAERQENDAVPRAMYEQSLQLRRELGDERALANVLHAFSAFQYMHGEHDAARQYAQEALSLARALDDVPLTAHLLNHLGRLELARSEPVAARMYLQESLLISREANHAATAAGALYNLGNAALHDGKYVEAQQILLEALTLERGRGDIAMARRVLVSLCSTAIGLDDFARARGWAEESLELARQLHDRYGEAFSRHRLGSLDFWQGNLSSARQEWETSLRLARDIGANTGAARLAQTALGYLDLAEGNATAAEATGTAMVAAWRAVHDKQDEAHALGLLGYAAMMRNDFSSAQNILENRLEIARVTEQIPSIAEGLFDLGYLYFKQNVLARAKSLFQELLRAAYLANSISWIALSVLGFALLAEPDDARRAVQLFHANAVLFGKIQMSRNSLPSIVRDDVIQTETRARHSLDAETLAQAWNETQVWTPLQVYDYALTETGRVPKNSRRSKKQ